MLSFYTDVDVRDGKKVFFFNVYGHSGARHGGKTLEDNEELLMKVMMETANYEGHATYIMGDLNTQIGESKALSITTEKAIFVDIQKSKGLVSPTYGSAHARRRASHLLRVSRVTWRVT